MSLATLQDRRLIYIQISIVFPYTFSEQLEVEFKSLIYKSIEIWNSSGKT